MMHWPAKLSIHPFQGVAMLDRGLQTPASWPRFTVRASYQLEQPMPETRHTRYAVCQSDDRPELSLVHRLGKSGHLHETRNGHPWVIQVTARDRYGKPTAHGIFFTVSCAMGTRYIPLETIAATPPLALALGLYDFEVPDAS